MIAENIDLFNKLTLGERRSLAQCRTIRDQIEEYLVNSIRDTNKRAEESGNIDFFNEVGKVKSHEMAKERLEKMVVFHAEREQAKAEVAEFFQAKASHKKKPLERLDYFAFLCNHVRILERDSAGLPLTPEEKESITK
jgi:hypothetical protein